MPFAEDQHPVGDLLAGDEHEPFRISVRLRAARRDLHHLDTGTGQDRVKGRGELPGPVPDKEPEAGGTVTQVHQRRHAGSPGSRAAVRAVTGIQTRRLREADRLMADDVEVAESQRDLSSTSICR